MSDIEIARCAVGLALLVGATGGCSAASHTGESPGTEVLRDGGAKTPDAGADATADTPAPLEIGTFDDIGTDVLSSPRGPMKLGIGGAAFDPKDEGSSGVKVDPSGGIIIDPTGWAGGTTPLIWVANSQEGTISKVDTRKMKEVARYKTGPVRGGGGFGSQVDPSRTTVALNGDVVVVNRNGASATKIAANAADCVGKGTGTSKDGTDVRAWGDDKCVLWNTGDVFPVGSLGRAAAFDAETGLDGELSTSVWVGLYTHQSMWQLDSKTGKVLKVVAVDPINPYGAAVDRDHNIWIWGSSNVGKINGLTKKFTLIKSPPCAYGIAVDPKGRVWTSGGSCVARYTPATDLWESLNIGASGPGFGHSLRGLAVDAKGSVWIADTSFGVQQVDMEKLTHTKSIPLGGGGFAGTGFTGMAIDFDGMVWAISQSGSKAYKLDPATYKDESVPVGSGPYTYSDMTGFQLRNAASPFGKYRHVFIGCGESTRWTTLDWKASVPAKTTIRVRIRTGKTREELLAAPWRIVATSPPDNPPIDVSTVLGEGASAELFETEITLMSPEASFTPILSSLEMKSTCRGPT